MAVSSIVPSKALIGGEGGDFKVSSEILAQHPSNQLVAVVFLKQGAVSSVVPLKALIGGEGGGF